ncbi:late embryogenesis abundant protein At1g64065-like [Herrania umbratica]|uniref:Late embryogenesis abundant protein At1g64065-like n=1 Tax=Herrania umbratica TaxID=108875 RepID=A0A6J1BD29_9ROSI|nr:late embryogenesis abundant protein At1g64065-like [Herrania umbratica]
MLQLLLFQTAIILLFALTVMRIKSPKVRFGAVTVESFSTVNNSSPSFDMKLMAQVAVKNTNFGHFKYENSTVTILYGGMPVGEAAIVKGRARARQTKKFNINVDISSSRLSSNSNLGNDINAGVLPLSSQAKLKGKVHLMKVIKKKKSGEMSCTMGINLSTRANKSHKFRSSASSLYQFDGAADNCPAFSDYEALWMELTSL